MIAVVIFVVSPDMIYFLVLLIALKMLSVLSRSQQIATSDVYSISL